MKKTYGKYSGFVRYKGVNELHKERIKINNCKKGGENGFNGLKIEANHGTKHLLSTLQAPLSGTIACVPG